MLKAIKTKKEHEAALKRVYSLIQQNSKKGSDKSNELEVLAILIEKYEDENYPVAPPHPLEAIKFIAQTKGINNSKLAKYMGHKSRVSEIMKGKRKLTLPMIRSLNKNLKIPADTLIKEY